MEDIIIWGAGKAAIARYEWAVLGRYNVLFFVDNNPDVWEKELNGRLILPPTVLEKYSCTILTSGMYFDEIKAQLGEMAYRGTVIEIGRFKKAVVCQENIDVDLPQINIGEKTSFLFDAYFPDTNWGGTEEWSCMVADHLSGLGIMTQMICGENDKFDKFFHNCLHFPIENEVEMIKKMAEKIAENLPCVVISRFTIVLYAARIVKTLFPDQIKIVVIPHGDNSGYYKELKQWGNKMDKIVCISKKIYTTLQAEYRSNRDMLIYHPNPIRIPKGIKRRTVSSKTLKVGFAGRLVKTAKRAHLLSEVIEECMKRDMEIEFNIAGEGDCMEMIRTYVADRKLESKVHIWGWILPDEMVRFWEDQDIYLSVSEHEGMSLAMLEAMVCGAVPVVTDVSGVRDVIEDGKNGCVVSVDHWLETVDKIELLNRDRELLYHAAINNMEMIKEKYDVKDYARWMRDTFYF